MLHLIIYTGVLIPAAFDLFPWDLTIKDPYEISYKMGNSSSKLFCFSLWGKEEADVVLSFSPMASLIC